MNNDDEDGVCLCANVRRCHRIYVEFHDILAAVKMINHFVMCFVWDDVTVAQKLQS